MEGGGNGHLLNNPIPASWRRSMFVEYIRKRQRVEPPYRKPSDTHTHEKGKKIHQNWQTVNKQACRKKHTRGKYERPKNLKVWNRVKNTFRRSQRVCTRQKRNPRNQWTLGGHKQKGTASHSSKMIQWNKKKNKQTEQKRRKERRIKTEVEKKKTKDEQTAGRKRHQAPFLCHNSAIHWMDFGNNQKQTLATLASLPAPHSIHTPINSQSR